MRGRVSQASFGNRAGDCTPADSQTLKSEVGGNWAADLALLDRDDRFAFRFNGGPGSQLSLTYDRQFAPLQFELFVDGKSLGAFSGTIDLFSVLPTTRYGSNATLGFDDRVFAPSGGLNPRYRLEFTESEGSQVKVERQADRSLQITGTEFDDIVEIRETADQIVVRGITRINGISTPLVVARYPRGEIELIRFSGAAGNDRVVNATAIDSVLAGGLGEDDLYGGTGADELVGDGGNDLLVGWYGRDTYRFRGEGLGEDRLVEPEDANSPDTLDFSEFNHPVTVDLSRTENPVAPGHLRLTMESAPVVNGELQFGQGARQSNVFENIVGTRFDDLIRGNSAPNRLDGGNGNDTLLGALGVDRLFGGEGTDFLDGGAGLNDFLDGGAGVNRLIDVDDPRRINDLLGTDLVRQVESYLQTTVRESINRTTESLDPALLEQMIRDAINLEIADTGFQLTTLEINVGRLADNTLELRMAWQRPLSKSRSLWGTSRTGTWISPSVLRCSSTRSFSRRVCIAWRSIHM